jgi:hypothetical protein
VAIAPPCTRAAVRSSRGRASSEPGHTDVNLHSTSRTHHLQELPSISAFEICNGPVARQASPGSAPRTTSNAIPSYVRPEARIMETPFNENPSYPAGDATMPSSMRSWPASKATLALLHR